MRQIKFRAKKDDMSNFCWVYGMLVYNESQDPRIQDENCENKHLFTTCVKGTEGQYTGLKDKNGKEIYEGDIITNRDGTWEVEYIEDFASFHMVAGNEMQSLNMCCRSNKVIGNIYENKELIKNGN